MYPGQWRVAYEDDKRLQIDFRCHGTRDMEVVLTESHGAWPWIIEWARRKLTISTDWILEELRVRNTYAQLSFRKAN